MLQIPFKNFKIQTKQYLVVTANLLAMSCGFAFSWSSPVLPKLTNENRTDENPLGQPISDMEQSWIASLLSVGSIIGPWPWSYLSDKIGRKFTLILLALPMLISYFILAFAQIVVLYFVARFLQGFAFGGILGVIFMYLGEISEINNRGILSASFNTFLTFGQLVSYVLGVYLRIRMFNIVCGIVPVVFICLFFIFAPESPAFILKDANNLEAATKALKRIRSNVGDLQMELKEIKEEIKKSSDGHLKDLFINKGLFKGLKITVTLVIFQQLSGISVVLFYAETIFDATKSEISPEISAIIVGIVQFLSSFIAPTLVDRFGRTILFKTSALGMLISETVLGIYFYLNDNQIVDLQIISFLPVLMMVLYLIMFNCAFGPLPYTIMGEIFPSNVRFLANSATACTGSVVSFLTTQFFIKIADVIGMAGTFWLFAGFCFLAFVFVMVYVPETKGKSLLEIHKELNV